MTLIVLNISKNKFYMTIFRWHKIYRIINILFFVTPFQRRRDSHTDVELNQPIQKMNRQTDRHTDVELNYMEDGQINRYTDRHTDVELNYMEDKQLDRQKDSHIDVEIIYIEN